MSDTLTKQSGACSQTQPRLRGLRDHSRSRGEDRLRRRRGSSMGTQREGARGGEAWLGGLGGVIDRVREGAAVLQGLGAGAKMPAYISYI